MKQTAAILVVFVMFLAAASTAAPAEGYFTVGQQDGRWWLFDPDGEKFFSTGVNALTPYGHYCPATGRHAYRDRIIELYGTHEAWAEVVLQRMDEWGFNTLGGWCDSDLFQGDLPYTNVLYMSGADWLTGYVPDYWSEEFYDHVEESSQPCLDLADDPMFIGYYIDNEMRWGPDWRRLADLFSDYIELPPFAPGKLELQRWIQARYQYRLADFNRSYDLHLLDWVDFQFIKRVSNLPSGPVQGAEREAWTAFVADHFFEVVTEAIRAKDPNHMVLGARMVSWLTPRVVVEASAQYLDVLSINHYQVWPIYQTLDLLAADPLGFIPTHDMLVEFYETTDLPILITEFGFRGLDALPPSTFPPRWLFMTADTQTERTQFALDYITECIESEYCLGYHWFDWVDEPELGRFDGEDSNFGLVSELDEPYEELVTMFSENNQRVYEWPLDKR